MKKLFLILISFCLFFSCLTACGNKDTNDNTTNTTTPVLPFEEVKDEGDVEFEKEYTIDEILEIKTNWNKEYVFLKDFDDVIIEKTDSKNIKMSLTTKNQTFDEAVAFYQKYTANKDRNSTKTPESYFVSFVDEYVARTILVVKNQNDIYIEINYSLDDVNKR